MNNRLVEAFDPTYQMPTARLRPMRAALNSTTAVGEAVRRATGVEVVQAEALPVEALTPD